MQAENQFVDILQDWIHLLMHRTMGDFFEQAKADGLSMTQIGALFRIRDKNMCGVSEIGDELGVTSAAASQMIDRLVLQGLISRTEDPHDRRLKQIVLMEKGEQVLHAGLCARRRWLEELGSRLTPAEREQVEASLRLLIENAGELEQPPAKVRA